ncbi:MAG: hypothetical protein Ta2A_09020 [Treponemataceae bacterium]|nr:MAG: hypothetical protein Ta2A_09020 [Treponemataceae bacterium]
MGVENEITGEAKKILPQIYADVAQPAAKEIGSVLGHTVRASLAPLRGLLWGWDRIEQMIIDGVEKRWISRPQENIKTPNLEIAVPLIQTLSYSAQNETLREMYLNLLSNSMDRSQEKNVHPSFVDIIKQMDTLDAKLFKELTNNERHKERYIKAINPTISITDQGKSFHNATPEWFIGLTIDNYSFFDTSASLIRLGRLGIVVLMFEKTTGNEGYSELKQSPFLIQILNQYKQAYPFLNLAILGTDSVLYVNEFGKQFAQSCL